jgi:murein DD-endopeptidase MepM/ murein hydrolase activator NlpD
LRAAIFAACVALLFLLSSSALLLAAPEIELTPESPRPGDVILITLRAEEPLLRAACSWGGRSYRFLETQESYGLALPVALTTEPGAHHATVYWKYAAGGMGHTTIPVRVARREFGVQNLRLSANQERQYSAPETERERRLIGAALDIVSPQRHWHGPFIRPLEGRTSTEFGLQRHINGRIAYRHRGVDIAAPEGTLVRSAAAGVVSLADDSFLLHGQTIIVDHGQGVSTLYLHLSQLDVSPGEIVSQGQVVGRVGSTGVATGPHLHFAAYAYHEPVDPFFLTELE